MDIRRHRSFINSLSFFQHFKIALLPLLLIGTFSLVSQLNLPTYFRIKTVRVYGVNHINTEQVKSILLPLVNRGFFSINVDFIKERLLQIPWLADILVKRSWPDRIDITLIEKKAVARWHQEGLLSDTGELFAPDKKTYPLHLPLFIGPPGQRVMMLQYYTQFVRLLAPLHTKIASLELTPYFTWRLKLDNQIILQINHKETLTRLDHFVKVYPKIVGNRTADVDYIDLRYANGAAIRWKETIKT
jgi:cell division protein FtsQ